ncbi:MAG: hypothetical protein EOM23_00640 [Candidatus Moranbacteria bacterium]|nr:hypothetical protein [Candidatus Moranbacteria bacterium]
MNKQINIILSSTVLVLIVGVLGISIWLSANNKNSIQSTNQEDSGVLINKRNSTASKQEAMEVVAYKLENKIFFYDPKNQQEKIIFSSDKLMDFDISQDGKYLTYSLKEDGFEGNADIYFLDIANQKTVRLTEKNNIASLSPKIYSNGKKIAYMRRTFDAKNGKLRDGEIWTIDASGDINSSFKLFGDESESWFELNPEIRCCVCDEWDEPYEPESMLVFNSISEDGNFISYQQGNFDLMCFAGFLMENRLYDVRKKEVIVDTEILQSKNNEYYAQIYSVFPSDPFPFCIKNTFFDKNGKLVWAPEKEVTDNCQHDYYYKPLDFEVNGNEVNMVYLNNRVLSKNSFVIGGDIKKYFTQKNLDDMVYIPKVHYMADGRVNYQDSILSARQMDNHVVFLEGKFESEYPTLNIINTDTKNIQKTINLDNNQNFKVVLVE